MRKRTISTVAATMTQTVDANNKSVDLPVDGPLSAITLRHRGTLTVGTADASAVVDGDYKNLYQNLKLVADGKLNLVSGGVNLRQNLRRTELREGRAMNNSTAAAVTIATYTVEISHKIYFALKNWPKQGQHPLFRTSELDTRRFKTLKLSWDEKALNNWLTPAGTTVLSVGTLATEVCVWEPEEDDQTAQALRRFVPYLEAGSFTYTTAGQQAAIDLLDERWLRGIYFQARNAGVPDNNLSDIRLDLFQGQTLVQPENRSGGINQSDLQANSGIQVGQGASPADNEGDYWLDLDQDGDNSDLVDLRRSAGTSSAKLFLSTTAAGSGTRDVNYLVEKLALIE